MMKIINKYNLSPDFLQLFWLLFLIKVVFFRRAPLGGLQSALTQTDWDNNKALKAEIHKIKPIFGQILLKPDFPLKTLKFL